MLNVLVGGRGAKSAATWQPSCQKVFEESDSERKFWILFPFSPAIEQFGGRVKEIILILLEKGHIFYPFFHNTTKKQYDAI